MVPETPSPWCPAPRFDPDAFRAHLWIDASQVGDDGRAETAALLGLKRKEEFHVTVLGGDAADALEASPAWRGPDGDALRRELQEAFERYAWEIRPGKEFFTLEKHYPDKTPLETRATLVRAVEVPGLDGFIALANRLFGTAVPVPLAHVTLYSGSTNPANTLRGIGLPSRARFDALKPRHA